MPDHDFTLDMLKSGLTMKSGMPVFAMYRPPPFEKKLVAISRKFGTGSTTAFTDPPYPVFVKVELGVVLVPGLKVLNSLTRKAASMCWCVLPVFGSKAILPMMSGMRFG